MAKIAISYRRSDSQDITGRIFDRLVQRYGKDTVFRDIDSIEPGIDFRRQIAEALRTTDVLLVVAGPGWLGQSKDAERRIENEADPVRIEVETALKRDIPIIPILVNGMTMPAVADLPQSLKDFAYRHAVTVDGGRDFDHHIDGLIRSLDRIVRPQAGVGKGKAPSSPPWGAYGLIGGAVVAVVVVAAVLFGRHAGQSPATAPPPVVQALPPAPVSQPVTATAPSVVTPAPPAGEPATQPSPRVADIPVAATPTFDCATSHGVDEIAICHSGQLSYLDQQLNVVFYGLRGRLTKEQQAVLSAQELVWLKQRAACGSDEACIRNAYLSRIAQLQSWH